MVAILFLSTPGKAQVDPDAELIEAYRAQKRASGHHWSSGKVKLPDGRKIKPPRRPGFKFDNWVCIEDENRMRQNNFPMKSTDALEFHTGPREDVRIEPIQRPTPQTFRPKSENHTQAPYRKVEKIVLMKLL